MTLVRYTDILKLPFDTMMYHYPYGNHLGVVSFLWRIPDGEIDQTQVSRFLWFFLKFFSYSSLNSIAFLKLLSHPYKSAE